MERTNKGTKSKRGTGSAFYRSDLCDPDPVLRYYRFPLLHIVSGSFSDPMAPLRGEVSFWPKGFDVFHVTKRVFKDASIWQGYGNTIVYTVLGTCISVVLTAFAA